MCQILRKQFTIASFQSTNVLQQHLKVIKLDDADGIQDANQARDSDVDLICHSLQRLYIQCVRPVRYKVGLAIWESTHYRLKARLRVAGL